MLTPTNGWMAQGFYCPQSLAPVAVPDAATIRDRVIRLLPRVEIGTAGPTPTSLVNIQTLFWARTGEDRDLGRVSVVGQPVWLRIAFDHADWAFGDGQHDTTYQPGRPYDEVTDPCAEVLCPDYYGHVYRDKGPMTITLRVSWNATFSLDGHSFVPVEGGVVTGPAASTLLTVREARGVLVANPGD